MNVLWPQEYFMIAGEKNITMFIFQAYLRGTNSDMWNNICPVIQWEKNALSHRVLSIIIDHLFVLSFTYLNIKPDLPITMQILMDDSSSHHLEMVLLKM